MKRSVQMARAGVPSARPGAPVVERKPGKKREGFITLPPIFTALHRFLFWDDK